MNITEAIKKHGLEYLRGRAVTDGSRRLFIHDDDLNAAIALWADEPEHAYRQRRFYGGDTRNAPMCAWIYGSYTVLEDEPVRQTAAECASALNGHADAAHSLATLAHDGQDYELRICGIGKDAYFEWINEGGDPVGDAFFEFDGVEREKARFAALLTASTTGESHA